MSKEIEARLAAAEQEVKALRELLEAKKKQWIGLPDSCDEDGFLVNAAGTVSAAGYKNFVNAFDYGNRFHTREQAEAFAHAWSVMLRIRRMPGIVDPTVSGSIIIVANADRVFLSSGLRIAASFGPSGKGLSIHMFPAFGSRESAQAAIDVIGADNLIKCAKTLAFVGVGGE